MLLRNKAPAFDDKLKVYILDFKGKVKEASVKNFILHDDYTKKDCLLFGKYAEERYLMELTYPLSPVQALSKKANVNVEGKAVLYAEPKKKWTPLVWASCKGLLPIVKLLLLRGAHLQYTVVDPNNRLVVMGTNR